MELLQLQYFYESATTQNFAKTAETHFVPPSSVSGAVRRLEKELGCQLFDRSSNRLTLNQSGKRLQQALEIAFGEINQAVRELSSGEDQRQLRILVRTIPTDFHKTLATFHRSAPHVQARVDFIRADLPLDQYHIIIDKQSSSYPDRMQTEFCRLRLQLVASQASPLKGKKLTMHQLRQQAFVLSGEDSPAYEALLYACRKAGFRPNISFCSNDAACCRMLVASGLGIGIEPEPSQTARVQKLTALHVTDFSEEFSVCAYCKENETWGNVALFLAFLQNN